MRRILLIARREYVYNFRKKSYLFSAFGVPILIFAMWGVAFALAEADTTGGLGVIGYVDLADVAVPDVEAPAGFVMFDSLEVMEAAFAAREIGGYFVITANYWNDGSVETYAPVTFSGRVQERIEGFLRDNVATRAPADRAERLRDPVEITFRMMDNPMTFSGDAIFALILLPIAFVLVFMMATTVTSQFLMQGVAEEKENRIMEILTTSASPEQMLAGKVLGLGGLGLTQIAIWLVVAVVILLVSDPASPIAQMLRMSPLVWLIVLVYFVLGYLFFGAMMAGLGAAVSAEQEGRQLASVFSLTFVLPMMLSFTFYQDPNGPIPVLLSLIPFTSPVAMLFRLPIASVPAWQYALSIGLLAGSTVIAIWVSARVFRLGMLMYGKRLSLREILSILRPGAGAPSFRTTAAGETREGGLRRAK